VRCAVPSTVGPYHSPVAQGRNSAFRRLSTLLGLTYAPGAEPSANAPSKSRYRRGFEVSPRLDEDLDDLRRRVAALEQRLDRE
jgi:hypothetical protein